MRQSYDLLFASSNQHKYVEVKQILRDFGINIGFFKYNFQELQSNSIKIIASKKAQDAFVQCKKPVIIEDDGIFIDSLKGFPGPYSSFVFQTIGNKGILNLVKTHRRAKFKSVIAFCDKKHQELFEANIKGRISKTLRGRGWGYDPIFIPDGKNTTYAELDEKNLVSHRYKALKKFSNWYLDRQESIDR